MIDKIRNEARLIWRLLLDTRVPFWPKLIPAVALLYILSPIDLIPDVLIGLGQLDDLGILLGSLRLFKSLIPEHLIEEHQAIINGRVIEARRYRVIDRE
ncbi:MAG TPA: DUF1232 domain-containing protein [Spirillospora sp.]|nr:DUF1232 domain-containing protein [Spirillospora sp.]